MTTVSTDVDTLTAEAEPLELTSGLTVSVKRIRTRETFKLMRILTRGVSGSIGSLLMAGNDDEESFTGALLGAVIVAVPEAEDEAIDFIQAMVEPAKLIQDPRTKPERESNQEQYDRLARELQNPELEDTIVIIERVVRNEAPQIRALGNRLALLLKTQASSAEAKQGGSSKRGSKS